MLSPVIIFSHCFSLFLSHIGMWFNILQFLNVCGVVSNAFLVAFTSTWGQQYGALGQLWIVIIFEVSASTYKYIIFCDNHFICDEVIGLF